MRRTLLFLAALLLLCGCQRMYPDEYISVNEHEAPFAYRETVTEPATTEAKPEPEILTVSRAYDIREGIQDLVMNGEEAGQFRLKNYVGDVEADMKNMFNTLLSDSPKINYAMDSFDWTIQRDKDGTLVTVEMKLRLAPQEIQAIQTRLFPDAAMSSIYTALRQQLSSYTVQVSGYQETDFNALLDEYILNHPDQIVEMPGVSVAVYPDRGNVRVVELHFVYHSDRETLRQHKDETVSFLNLAVRQLDRDMNAKEIVETLYKQLVPGIGYESSEEATVYTQTLQKIGSSRTMSSVAAYLCNRAGIECEIVQGELDGERWYWNRIQAEGAWLHFDLHAAALSGKPPVLLPSEAMPDYSWDPERYPELEAPEPSEPTEPTESTEAEKATEPTETKADAESSEPLLTEPAAPAP